MPDLTGGAKKSCLQVVQLCLKVSGQLILFAVFGITFLQHFLQGTDQLVLSVLFSCEIVSLSSKSWISLTPEGIVFRSFSMVQLYHKTSEKS